MTGPLGGILLPNPDRASPLNPKKELTNADQRQLQFCDYDGD